MMTNQRRNMFFKCPTRYFINNKIVLLCSVMFIYEYKKRNGIPNIKYTFWGLERVIFAFKIVSRNSASDIIFLLTFLWFEYFKSHTPNVPATNTKIYWRHTYLALLKQLTPYFKQQLRSVLYMVLQDVI
jgi:hypothetical protein